MAKEASTSEIQRQSPSPDNPRALGHNSDTDAEAGEEYSQIRDG